MPDIYNVAWEILRDRIARSRKQAIPKADLISWQLQALEAAVNKFNFEAQCGKQEET